MKNTDYYLHTEESGSGSFILINHSNLISSPEEIDFYDAAEGVIALSNQWSKNHETGRVFYVLGNQVSKTPPTGEYLTKGSFMIYGKKKFIDIHNYKLGYGLYNKNQLMLAPYRVVKRLNSNTVKITPKYNQKKMKGKIISNYLKKKLNITLIDSISLFNKPCYLS